MPRLLNDDQKVSRVNVCKNLQQRVEHEQEFMSRVITGDKTWVYGYDPETKQQSSQWKSPSPPRPYKAKAVNFFDIHGLVHFEFVPPSQTVNQQFYKLGSSTFAKQSQEKATSNS